MHPSTGPHQRGARAPRHRRPGVADRPAHRPAVGGVRRCLEGRRHRPGDLHRGHPVDPGGVLRRRQAGGRGLGEVPPRDRAPDRNATFTVILLSFISGLRTFDLIWTMTRGGPGFTTDVITSTIYKEYQAGFYGLVDRRQRGSSSSSSRSSSIRCCGSSTARRSSCESGTRPARSLGRRRRAARRAASCSSCRSCSCCSPPPRTGPRRRNLAFTLPDRMAAPGERPGGHGARQRRDGHGVHEQHHPDGRLGDADRGPVGDGRLRAPAAAGPVGAAGRRFVLAGLVCRPRSCRPSSCSRRSAVQDAARPDPGRGRFS